LETERAIERRRDDLRLESHLLRVSDLLPIASAASRQVGTGRRAARGARLEHALGVRDQMPRALLGNRDLEQVARRRVGHHHGPALEPSESERPECHCGYLDLCHRKSGCADAVRSYHIADAMSDGIAVRAAADL